MKSHYFKILPIVICSIIISFQLIAQNEPGENIEKQKNPYKPLEFLIGTWTIDGVAGFENTFEWGFEKKYIRWSSKVPADSGITQGWEGLIVWNGVTDSYQFMMPLTDVKTIILEEGVFVPLENGSLRRDIRVWYSPGTELGSVQVGVGGYVRDYEQMFIPIDSVTVQSSVFYKTRKGNWEPSFPGSEKFILKRKE